MSSKRRGIIGSIIFHSGLLFIFLYFGFTTPLPLPAEQGILINFGDSDFGAGTTEPRQNTRVEQQVESPPVRQVEDRAEQQTLTQDFEEAPAVEANPGETVKEQPEDVTTDQPTQQTVEEEPVEEPRRTVNQNALYRGRTEDGGTQGEGRTYPEGNQGNATGDPNSDNRTLGQSLGGNGNTISLEGRSIQSFPEPEYNQQVEGKVVVEITVDQTGRVVNAIPGVKGSTTNNSYLLNSAKQAALRARFDKKPDAPTMQKGTITYNFILN
ncbi:MAG: TonB family protein [Bacteroidota bacterium]